MLGRARTWLAAVSRQREERRRAREEEVARLAAQRAEEARRKEEERQRFERQRKVMNFLFRAGLIVSAFLLLFGYLRDNDVLMAVGGSILIAWVVGELLRGFIVFTSLVVIAGIILVLFPPLGLLLFLGLSLTPRIDIDIFDIDLFG